MHFLRYLIFIIISLFSVQVFAAQQQWWYSTLYGEAIGSFDIAVACELVAKKRWDTSTTSYRSSQVVTGNQCSVYYMKGTVGPYSELMPGFTYKLKEPTKCPASGWPIPIYFDPNTPVPLRTCNKTPEGSYCITQWTGDPNRPIVISGSQYQSITHASVSEIPSPSCTPEFSKSSCDPKDPYGGCYKPPDDGCNRMADGSIYCPEGTPPPPIQSGCSNNATYCDMPPTGCGPNYVPGTFNGKQICVKKSNPPPTDPIPQPPSASEPPPIDPENPPPASSPPPALPPESNSIMRSILDAVNAVNNKLTWVKDEIVNSVNNVSRTLGITNQKLDAVNSSVKETTAAVKETTAAVNNVKTAVDANANTVKTAVDANANTVKGAVDANTTSTANKLNEVVNAINNKPVGGGGSAPDMKPTNDLLTDIKNFLTGGTLPEDKGEKLETKELTNQSFNTGLITTGGSVCPDDYPINWSTPFGTINKSISFQNLCAQSSWIGYLVLAAAYMIAAGIVVRA
ncbi:hypothetical protein JZM37_00215 [Acinetobacter pittii]|uniref:virulence factor TspB C-terminal domain-related protein n=1 Tax=Acinetobacter pittii TaxID=48296 RepID=UPI0019805B85|nr:virulence factor TspB C-terminal domain-related protein [Acinetobacter pittii]MBN6522674.1 hypothetical protein [Acinetobacter pittii]